ncbi:MAG TPA: MarR family winged helix-turn-helix transcriptional regulator [Steroidobacteraceae bacterium]|nr:MarR family winged helix-turn-helix transcriptional regulator [Steroidobacteraceae bacterium]
MIIGSDLPFLKSGAISDVAQPAVGTLGTLCNRIRLQRRCCNAESVEPATSHISVLADNDGVDQITLAGLAALNRTTAGEIVDRMVSARLLERRDNPLDRRVKNIFLTKPSLRLLSELHHAVLRVRPGAKFPQPKVPEAGMDANEDELLRCH